MKVLNEDMIGPWSMEVNCTCGAILEVGIEDFEKYGTIEDGFSVGVVCIRCHSRIMVEDAPAIVWDAV